MSRKPRKKLTASEKKKRAAAHEQAVRENVRKQLTALPKPVPPEHRTRTRIAGGGPKVKTNLRQNYESEALGVSPEQCEEAEAAAKAAGVPTQFNRETGDAIITGPEHLQKLAKSIGMKTGRDGYDHEHNRSGRRVGKDNETKRRELMDSVLSGQAGYPAGMEPIPMARGENE